MTAVQTQADALRVDELRLLEAEAVHIIREVVAELERVLGPTRALPASTAEQAKSSRVLISKFLGI
jgi:hypothetical protein